MIENIDLIQYLKEGKKGCPFLVAPKFCSIHKKEVSDNDLKWLCGGHDYERCQQFWNRYIDQQRHLPSYIKPTSKDLCCPRCHSSVYMVKRVSILDIDPDKNPYMCVKCTHSDHFQSGNFSEGCLKLEVDEIMHLEGIKQYIYNEEGRKIKINSKTRKYEIIEED